MSGRTSSSVNRSTTGSHRIQLLNPLPSKHYLIYIPMRWATNTSLYVFGTVSGSGAIVHQLALLRDSRKDVTQQGSNLQAITASGQNFTCQDDDVTPDNTQLVCSAALLTERSSSSSIKMWPIAGGTQRVVYQGQPGEESVTARAISNSTLLFLHTKINALPTLLRIKTDGSGLKQLMAAPTGDADLEFASSSYLPWSITSRDGMYYTLTMYNMTSNTSSLIVGSLAGGQSETIVTSTNPVQIAGWA